MKIPHGVLNITWVACKPFSILGVFKTGGHLHTIVEKIDVMVSTSVEVFLLEPIIRHTIYLQGSTLDESKWAL